MSHSRLKFGYVMVSADPLSALEQGVLAEKAGFDALWLPDHFVDVNGDRLEPWSVLAAIAMKTRRITLGSAVTDTQRSHPARTAHSLACLDIISNGRAILGIGAGEAMNIVPFGLPWGSPRERVARLAEAIQIINLLWKSSRELPTSFAGNYYKLDKAFLSQQPKQKPHPPIFVGAFSSKGALEVVGRFGDGWFAWLNTPETFRKRWAIIKRAAESSGRSPEKIEPASHLMMALPRNSSEKRMAMLAAKATLLMEKSILASFGFALDSEQYQHLMVLKEDVARVMAAAESVPDEFVHKVMAIGGIDEVKQKIGELTSAGVKHLAVVDFLAPKSVKRTLPILRKTIRKYS